MIEICFDIFFFFLLKNTIKKKLKAKDKGHQTIDEP